MAKKFLDSAGLTYFINKIVYGITSPKFSTGSTYTVGNFVIYTGNLYRCTTAVTVAGAWSASKWVQTTVSAELATINSNLVYDSETGYLKGYKTGADTWSPFSSIKLLGFFQGSTTGSVGGLVTQTSALNNTKSTVKIFLASPYVSSITVSSGIMVVETTISSYVKLYKVTGMSLNSTITVTSEWASGVGAFE